MEVFVRKNNTVIYTAVAVCVNAMLLVMLTLMGNTLSTDKNGTGMVMKQLDVGRRIYADNISDKKTANYANVEKEFFGTVA